MMSDSSATPERIVSEIFCREALGQILLIALVDKRAQHPANRAERFSPITGIALRSARCQSPDHKFLKNVGGGRCPNPDKRVFKRQSRSIAIFRRIIEIRDAACSEASEDSRVICLPVTIVTLADDRIRHCIQNPRSFTAGSLIEITRILFQQRWQNRASDQCARSRVGVGCPVALCVSLCALAISAEVILCLLYSGDSPCQSKVDWIHQLLPGKFEFLFRRERSCIGDVAHIEIRNEAERTLLLLFLDLLFRYFDLEAPPA